MKVSVKFLIFVGLTMFYPFLTSAQPIVEVSTQKKFNLTGFVNLLSPGDVLLVGETHATSGYEYTDQYDQQKLIAELVQQFTNVSVAMEFISYPSQNQVDLFLNGKILETDFLNKINWSQNPFEAYKLQVLLPTTGSGWTYGINSPLELTSWVGRNGLKQLTPELAKWLPENFQLGSLLYKQRLIEELSFLSHPGMNLDYYFEVQSIWDDTMASEIAKIMKKNPSQILVVIVGQFHVMYELGLPARLQARGVNNVKSLVQLSSYKDLSQTELDVLVNHPKYGLIADFIWY